MSLPAFSTQSELFSTAGLSTSLFGPKDPYALFARLVYPHLAEARSLLEGCYCADNGRVAIEPVLLLGVSILQELEGMPDRQAVDQLRYHAGWNFALNRHIGDPLFHPSSLVNFRNRLAEHDQSALGFKTIWGALEKAGLVSRQSRQRLDSTQMFGRVARMSRLDCVRESLRLGLQELEGLVEPEVRPVFWLELWERYVESQADYRAGTEILTRKMVEAGNDAWQLLNWLRQPEQSVLACGPQTQLLWRVFGEQFEVVAGTAALLAQEKQAVVEASSPSVPMQIPQATVQVAVEPPALPCEAPLPSGQQAVAPQEAKAGMEVVAGVAQVQPKGKEQLDSARVQNPHDPEATYAVKGQGEKKKEHVGFKVQVAETVSEATLAAGEPTRNFIAGILTHPAHQSDQAGAVQMEAEQAAMGLEKPPVQYVDGAYISGQQLAAAAAQQRELIGPAPAAPDNNGGRFTTEQFQVQVEERTAVCPAGHQNTQCSRLEEQESGKVTFRFEWSAHCTECPLRPQCVGPKQKHRTIVVGEHHTALQARRMEQQTHSFKERMKHRNGIEGTQSELVRGHGLRRARYRGLVKARLQNYFIGAACNVKRWIRREVWKIQQAVLRATAQGTAAATS